MISGTVEAVSVKPFVTKAGASMFKIGYKIAGAWYNSVSKFEQQRIKKGMDIFFEVQDQWPDSIVMGTIKTVTGPTANAILGDSYKPVTIDTRTLHEKKVADRKIAELERKIKELEDDQLLKELVGDFDDQIPF